MWGTEGEKNNAHRKRWEASNPSASRHEIAGYIKGENKTANNVTNDYAQTIINACASRGEP